MKRLLFVYNPTSGKGAITGNVTTIVDAFTKAGWLVTIYPTQGTGDATPAWLPGRAGGTTGWSAAAETAR